MRKSIILFSAITLSACGGSKDNPLHVEPTTPTMGEVKGLQVEPTTPTQGVVQNLQVEDTRPTKGVVYNHMGQQADVSLVLSDFDCKGGKIRNITDDYLENIHAVVTYRDFAGNVLMVVESWLEHNPVQPDGISSFTTMHDGINCEVEFRNIGEKIEYTTEEWLEFSKLEVEYGK